MFNKFHIDNVHPADEISLCNGVFLVLLHATHKPPHLALTVNGKYFALSVKGPEVDQEFVAVLRLISRKKIPSLFLELEMPLVFTSEQLNGILKKITLSYPRLDAGTATCLNPIKDFCSSVYDTETQNVNFIFDLLPKLEQKQLIKGSYHFYLDRFLESRRFTLPKYGMEEINEGIRKSMLAGIS